MKLSVQYGVSSIASAIVLALAVSSYAAAITPEDCDAFLRHGQRAQATSCYQALTQSADAYQRAEGDWGLKFYDQANSEFRTAVAEADGKPIPGPAAVLYRVRWGRLLHERFNNTDAEGLFREALDRDPGSAPALLGLAIVSADGFDNKALQYVHQVIERDPNLIEAHELLAELQLENDDIPAATVEADSAIRAAGGDRSLALDAMAIHAAIDAMSGQSPEVWLKQAVEINPSYGNAYAIVAGQLVINRRYDEGVTYYRKAIEIDPELWSARSQLAINLMRLGQVDEPRQQLELCYSNGYRDAATVNTLRLLDSEKDFTVFKDPATILKINKTEAGLLYPYFSDLMKRAMATYSKKYNMTLPDPVQVEVFTNHEDFAVRTYGMPGLGALGVTFGEVVAMDSPSARKPGSFNWSSTLWHELDHVYVLTATHHLAPRWFAEGLAVHEEGQESFAWGDRMSPEIVIAMHDKKLLPVSSLDAGFVHPTYDSQVLVSYFEAGRICDYISSRWGEGKLLDMIHSFSQPTTTAAVIQKDLGIPPEQFDKDFQAWVYKEAGSIVDNFDAWRANLKQLASLIEDQKYEDAIPLGEKVREMYPDYVYDANPYDFLAEAYLAKGDKPKAIAVLTDYQRYGGSAPSSLKQLSKLQLEAGQPAAAAATLDAVNQIYPVGDPELHTTLGIIWLGLKNYPAAIREYAAVIDLHPLDQAGANYNLAQAYFDAGQLDKAESSVMNALEAAPGYRPAQKLLLQIEDSLHHG